MADGWTSDWEILFAKCAVDADYRAQLASALAETGDTAALVLLDNIGVGGTGGARAQRVAALRSVKEPLGTALTQFGQGQPLAAAP